VGSRFNFGVNYDEYYAKNDTKWVGGI
jgi:hypothetical protein